MHNQLLAEDVKLDEINNVRTSVGLPKIKPQTRDCLNCERKFMSQNAAVRICDDCRKINERHSEE